MWAWTASVLLACAGLYGLNDPPKLSWIIAIAALSALAGCSRRHAYTKFFCLFGVCLVWSLGYTYWRISQLAVPIETKEQRICGWIDEIPKTDRSAVTFVFRVDKCGDRLDQKRIRMFWFKPITTLLYGQYWCFQARLKKNRGFSNPGGFDFERWTLLKNIVASAYIRSGTFFSEKKKFSPLNHFRQHIATKLVKSNYPKDLMGLIIALTIGSRHALSYEHNDLFQTAGISHLIAISGLHVGLVAAVGYKLFYFLLQGFTFYRRVITSSELAALLAWSFAGFYAVLSGLSAPTVRAMLALTVWLLAKLYRRQVAWGYAFQLLIIVSLCINPWHILDVAWLLSFGAVAWIIYVLNGRVHEKHHWLKLQISVSLGLIPLSLLFFQKFSLIGFLINIFAIPWVSCIILPGSLLLILFLWIPFVSDWILWFVTQNIAIMIKLVLWFSQLPYATVSLGLNHWSQGVALILFIMLCLAPKRFSGKYLSILLVPIIFYSPGLDPNNLVVSILDVGQGLAVVLHHDGKTLIYDTGPRYGPQDDAGRRVIIPYLRHHRIRQIDKLIISHGDLDHRGGLNSLRRVFPIKEIRSGEPKRLGGISAIACRAGQSWVWGRAKFQILHPDESIAGNDASCVLMIEFDHHRVLLPGDIESWVETQLVERYGRLLKADILVAAHHGSKTSSAQGWISAVKPTYVIFAVGHQNRFRFPHKQVVDRVCQSARCLLTSEVGAIQFVLAESIQLQRHRQQDRHFWHRL